MTRTLEQWKKEVDDDLGLVVFYLKNAAEDDAESRAKYLALALKEARRLQSDIYRIGSEVFGISREDIDGVGPL